MQKIELDENDPIRTNKGRDTRMVFRGFYDGQPAVVKMFIGIPKGWWHWRTCLRHGQALRERQIPSPSLLWSGWSEEYHAYLIIYEYLNDSRDFEWLRHSTDDRDRMDGFYKLLALFACMHSKGIEQSDTTPGNFLEKDGVVYAIDEDRMNIRSTPFAQKRSLRNIASMITQYPPLRESQIRKLLMYYTHERGWPNRDKNLNLVKKQIEVFRTWRNDKKAFRRRRAFSWSLAISGVLVFVAATYLLLLA